MLFIHCMYEDDSNKVKLNFEFETQNDTLLITAHTNTATFKGELKASPKIDLKQYQKYLKNDEYHTIENNFQSLKFSSNDMDFFLLNQEKLAINELIQEIQSLQKAIKDKGNDLQTNKQKLSFKQDRLNNMRKNFNRLKAKSQEVQKIPTIKFRSLHEKSKIVTFEHEQAMIQSFFSRKEIYRMKLLYRASENSFSAKKFKEKCNYVKNTLVLCQTKGNKKIGGFNPLTWERSWRSQEFAGDQPFIFSLSEGDKFQLRYGSEAILEYQDYGPCFGRDLQIRDKSHKNNLSFSYIKQSYDSTHYSDGKDESFSRFNGSFPGSPYFHMKEWEVWHVEFQFLYEGQAEIMNLQKYL